MTEGCFKSDANRDHPSPDGKDPDQGIQEKDGADNLDEGSGETESSSDGDDDSEYSEHWWGHVLVRVQGE